MNRGLWPVFLLLLLGCVSPGGHVPVPPGGGMAAPAEAVLAFEQRADAFYQRLLLRRFNALETFKDPLLRGYFHSEDLFFDYYADLAESLEAAHFEKSRPTSVELEEFVFESPTRVRVQVRFTGDDNRPLRPDRTTVVRLDRWEAKQESWWLEPGKL